MNPSTQQVAAPAAADEIKVSTMLRSWRGWPATEAYARLEQPVTLAEAFRTEWDDDRHFTAYAPVQNPRGHFVRAKYATLEKEVVVTMMLFVADIDAPNKQPTPEWRADLVRRLPLGSLSYPTAGGARIVWRLAVPWPIASRDAAAAWEEYYLTCCNALERRTSIKADHECKDFTRLYRLPSVMRDGHDRLPPLIAPAEIPVWDDAWIANADFPTPKVKVRRTAHPAGAAVEAHELVLVRMIVAHGGIDWCERDDKFDFECPGEHNSGNNAADGSTSVMPGTNPGCANCLHGTCSLRSDPDSANITPKLMAWLCENSKAKDVLAEHDRQRNAEAAAKTAKLNEMFGANDTAPDPAPAEPPRARDMGCDPAVNELIGNLAKPSLGVFQRARHLCTVVRDAVDSGGVIRPAGAPSIVELSSARLREIVRSACGQRDVELVGDVLARGEWAHIRPLDAIVTFPIMRRDGTLLLTSGYDAPTRTLAGIDLAVRVPDAPTLDDARAALATLTDVVGDFPFALPAARSAWLAMLLTIPARPAIDGPTPLGLLDATARGSGKSKLADVISVITTGREAPRRVAPKNKEEWDKTMLATLLAGDPIVLIDNVTGMLASDALDAVLTGTEYTQRLLGVSEERRVAIRTVFMVSANNARISSDLVRRSVSCRLEPECERPEQRTDFRHADLLGYVRAHRTDLLAAALTILRGYAVAGRPQVTAATMGSYESWCRVVRDALVWAGGTDPATTQDALRESADVERDELRDLLTAWHAALGDETVTVRALLDESLETHKPTTVALRDALRGIMPKDVEPSAHAIGMKLRSFRGQIVGGLVLREGKQDSRARAATWQVVHCC